MREFDGHAVALVDLSHVPPGLGLDTSEGDFEEEESQTGDARTVGRYQILKKIATGGMAELFLAKQVGLDGFEKVVAIKRILAHLSHDQDFVTMFRDEARIVAQLNHPNVVQIYDLGKSGSSYFIAMEYISGRNLSSVAKRAKSKGQALHPPYVARCVAQACEGLYYAHTQRGLNGQKLEIIHRDVSPQNIIVSFSGTVKLVDFGIAKAASKVAQTRAGVLKGKYAYMSPEQVRGETIDARSDLFAVGIVLYELLCGERPFEKDSSIQTLKAIVEDEPLPPRKLNPNIPGDLEAIILRCLSKDRKKRFQSAQEIQIALEDYVRLSQERCNNIAISQWLTDLYRQDLEDSNGATMMVQGLGEVVLPEVFSPEEGSKSKQPVRPLPPRPAERQISYPSERGSMLEESPIEVELDHGVRDDGATVFSKERPRSPQELAQGLLGAVEQREETPPPEDADFSSPDEDRTLGAEESEESRASTGVLVGTAEATRITPPGAFPLEDGALEDEALEDEEEVDNETVGPITYVGPTRSLPSGVHDDFAQESASDDTRADGDDEEEEDEAAPENAHSPEEQTLDPGVLLRPIQDFGLSEENDDPTWDRDMPISETGSDRTASFPAGVLGAGELNARVDVESSVDVFAADEIELEFTDDEVSSGSSQISGPTRAATRPLLPPSAPAVAGSVPKTEPAQPVTERPAETLPPTPLVPATDRTSSPGLGQAIGAIQLKSKPVEVFVPTPEPGWSEPGSALSTAPEHRQRSRRTPSPAGRSSSMLAEEPPTLPPVASAQAGRFEYDQLLQVDVEDSELATMMPDYEDAQFFSGEMETQSAQERHIPDPEVRHIPTPRRSRDSESSFSHPVATEPEESVAMPPPEPPPQARSFAWLLILATLLLFTTTFLAFRYYRPGEATLTLETNPNGAQVFINGVLQARPTPLTVGGLVDGQAYQILLRLKGHADIEQTFRFEGSTPVFLREQMEPLQPAELEEKDGG